MEDTLAKYVDHFGLEQHDLDGNGVQTSLVQAAVIRDVTRGIIPQRQRVNGAVPFNLMKSEQHVWVIQDMDYLETVVRRGTSRGVSVQVAQGLDHRPSTFRSRSIIREETIHADTGMLDLTTKHIDFAGSRKRFRVRGDKIVAGHEKGKATNAQTQESCAVRQGHVGRTGGQGICGVPTHSPPGARRDSGAGGMCRLRGLRTTCVRPRPVPGNDGEGHLAELQGP